VECEALMSKEICNKKIDLIIDVPIKTVVADLKSKNQVIKFGFRGLQYQLKVKIKPDEDKYHLRIYQAPVGAELLSPKIEISGHIIELENFRTQILAEFLCYKEYRYDLIAYTLIYIAIILVLLIFNYSFISFLIWALATVELLNRFIESVNKSFYFQKHVRQLEEVINNIGKISES
jgi:hypothetical protein